MSLSELLKGIQADINTAIKLEKKLKDDKYIDEIKTVVKIAKMGFVDAAGNALHRLDETKPIIDVVKELVEGFPDSLSFENKKDRLPIQSAVRNSNAVKYLPILAKVGIKHEIARWIIGCSSSFTTGPLFQLLACLGNSSNPIPTDTLRLDLLKELRKDNLLLKEFWSCRKD